MNTEEYAKAIYSLKLGEKYNENEEKWTRVPGGWIYQTRMGDSPSAVFIPWNNEFQPK